MKRNLPPGIGLVVGTVLWTGLTGWLLFAGPGPGAPADPDEHPSSSLWRRVSSRASALRSQRSGEQALTASLEEAVGRLGVPAWHAAGFKGKGVKVAVLDSGFMGYRKALGYALPLVVKTRSFRKDGHLEARDSQHGILCAEIIHRLAPEAEILLANWEPESPEHFLQAVRWARSEGAQVISCSLIMPTWSDGEGGGPIHAQLRELLGPETGKESALFVASAGNTALRHWGGPLKAGRDGWHEWAPGKIENALKPVGQERVSVELSAPAGSRFEVVVRDTLLHRDIGRGLTDPADSVASVAIRFEPKWGHRYSVRVRGRARERTHDPFHLVVLGGKLGVARSSGSIPFPGDGSEVVAVGAVDDTGRRMLYSSCGAGAEGGKPDLVAVVPFPSSFRAEQPFAGTSAAAPQAAALAALLWSRQPGWPPSQVRAALTKAARPPAGKPAHDPETGYGLIRLP